MPRVPGSGVDDELARLGPSDPKSSNSQSVPRGSRLRASSSSRAESPDQSS